MNEINTMEEETLIIKNRAQLAIEVTNGRTDFSNVKFENRIDLSMFIFSGQNLKGIDLDDLLERRCKLNIVDRPKVLYRDEILAEIKRVEDRENRIAITLLVLIGVPTILGLNWLFEYLVY